MSSLLNHLRHLLLAVIMLLSGFCMAEPALADAGAFLNSPSYADLEAAIASTKNSQRLAELEELRAAVATSDDRAQLSNATTHNVGVFARYKKDAADTAATFYVLSPGHQTDDDFELVALLVPPQVGLNWGENGSVPPAPSARVVRILEGEQLEVSEPANAQLDGASSYQLSLPAFSVTNSLAAVAEVPALSQNELDLAPETAPLD